MSVFVCLCVQAGSAIDDELAEAEALLNEAANRHVSEASADSDPSAAKFLWGADEHGDISYFSADASLSGLLGKESDTTLATPHTGFAAFNTTLNTLRREGV